ncbi:MAG: hypothetical protein R2706_15760, partial [Acidimicrobiales bacterium]
MSTQEATQTTNGAAAPRSCSARRSSRVRHCLVATLASNATTMAYVGGNGTPAFWLNAPIFATKRHTQ